MSNKQEQIIKMFNQIAPTYDMANRVLSLGIDIKWRKEACRRAFEVLGASKRIDIVDVATGTGDLLLHFRKEAAKQGVHVRSYVGVDPSIKMLDIAKSKVAFADFIEGKAQELPLQNESSDIVSIAFGIRNVVQRDQALKEFYRILRPGGVVMILEFTKRKRVGLLDKTVDVMLKHVLPIVGGLISQNYRAYRYLPDSIEAFLTARMLQDELASNGFDTVVTKNFTMGIATLIIAKKR